MVFASLFAPIFRTSNRRSALSRANRQLCHPLQRIERTQMFRMVLALILSIGWDLGFRDNLYPQCHLDGSALSKIKVGMTETQIIGMLGGPPADYSSWRNQTDAWRAFFHNPIPAEAISESCDPIQFSIIGQEGAKQKIILWAAYYDRWVWDNCIVTASFNVNNQIVSMSHFKLSRSDPAAQSLMKRCWVKRTTGIIYAFYQCLTDPNTYSHVYSLNN